MEKPVQLYPLDLEYVTARNALIPEAREYADREAGPEPEETGPIRDSWNFKWNRLFHARMDYLTGREDNDKRRVDKRKM